jgi:restriction endonuclease S subunit
LKKSLKQLASIRSGIFLKPQENGDLVYMQAKYFDSEGELSAVIYPDIKSQDVSEKHLLKAGEILFSAKGWKNFGAVYRTEYPVAVASTSFLVISLETEEVIPDYIALILNSPQSQEAFKGMSKGTSIPSITKKLLEEFEISVLPLEIQRKLVALSRLRVEETSILDQLERLNKLKLDLSILKIVQSYD